MALNKITGVPKVLTVPSAQINASPASQVSIAAYLGPRPCPWPHIECQYAQLDIFALVHRENLAHQAISVLVEQ